MLGAWGPVIGGSVLLLLLLFQILTGKRIIKFKGRMHIKVHTWVAYTMGVFALFHALSAIAFAFDLGP